MGKRRGGKEEKEVEGEDVWGGMFIMRGWDKRGSYRRKQHKHYASLTTRCGREWLTAYLKNRETEKEGESDKEGKNNRL